MSAWRDLLSALAQTGAAVLSIAEERQLHVVLRQHEWAALADDLARWSAVFRARGADALARHAALWSRFCEARASEALVHELGASLGTLPTQRTPAPVAAPRAQREPPHLRWSATRSRCIRRTGMRERRRDERTD